MILYRIAKCAYINDLSGAGARLYGGRWSSVGKPMVYLASTRSLAVLEVLVHLSPTMFPDSFCIAEIKVPDDSIKELAINNIPANWQDILPSIELKKIGDDFLKQQEGLLLKVPSAIVAEEFNYLLNPLHPAMSKVKLVKQLPFNFDQRLV
ncbi:RES family NAD+ phosphorylase [Mucilaginibacter sp.]